MKHLAAYLLLTIGGNTQPSAKDIKEVLSSVGIDVDESRLTQLLNELGERDIDQLIAEGTSKLATPIGPTTSGGEARVPETARDAEPREGSICDDCGDGDDDDDFGLGLFE